MCCLFFFFALLLLFQQPVFFFFWFLVFPFLDVKPKNQKMFFILSRKPQTSESEKLIRCTNVQILLITEREREREMMKVVALLVVLPLCESIGHIPKKHWLNGSPVSFSEKSFDDVNRNVFRRFERFPAEISTEAQVSIESIEFDIVDPVSEDLDMSTNVST